MAYLSLGTIVKTQGLKGEVRVLSCTDFALDRYKKGNTLYLQKKGQEVIPVTVRSYRPLDDAMDIVSFQEYEDINAITPFIGAEILIEKENASLPEGYTFHDDLIGCVVEDGETRQILGTVQKIERYASYDSLRIQKENGKTILIPYIKAFIEKEEIEQKRITIKHWEGLE